MEELAAKIQRFLSVDPRAVELKLVSFIKERVREAGARGVVVGMSGGMDSSTVACLCARALGSRGVLGISMPERGVTNPQDVEDARRLASSLGIEFKIVDITGALAEIQRSLGLKPEALLPAANIKPRLRMIVLYYHANLLNRLVAGTSNRSELRAGYFTKYGDGAADFLPLGCLYKTQVKRLAAHLGIPKRIIDKTPSAGLWRGQTDEGELGLSYEKIDGIYAGLDLGLGPEEISRALGIDRKEVERFILMEKRGAHKLAGPTVPRL